MVCKFCASVTVPLKFPTKLVAVTVPNPEIFVRVPPKATVLVPRVIELFTNAEFGILVSPAPDPLKVPAVTEVRPAKVRTVTPKVIVVVPIVIELLTNAVFGMLARPAPDPLNCVAVRTPVLGLNNKLLFTEADTLLLPVIELLKSRLKLVFVTTDVKLT